MARKEEVRESQEFVYRISTAKEWEELQKSGSTFGGDLDKTTGCIHLSKLDQGNSTTHIATYNKPLIDHLASLSTIFPVLVLIGFSRVKPTLKNFFTGMENLYLLQIDTKKLGDGLVYEAADGSNFFPHFYGPSGSFSPLPLNAVTKAENLTLSDGQFSCDLLN